MKINLNVNTLEEQGFNVLEKTIAKTRCYLITPKPDYHTWTEDTLIFRSSIWTEDGVLISASYPKFFNFDERPDLHPFTGKIFNWSVIEKIDGSALIVSKYKNELIIRTRGTVDAFQMPNGRELAMFLKSKAGQFLSNCAAETIPLSYIFEWVTPTNQIVIHYPEVEFYLTGIINHKDYSLFTQVELDELADNILFCKRPTRYNFYSIQDLINNVKDWEGKEGVCLYYNNDQNIRKIKSLNYLKLHAFRSNCTLKNISELIATNSYPPKDEFLRYIEREFDFECKKQSEPVINHVYNLLETIDKQIMEVQLFVKLNEELNQKEFAMLVKNTEIFIKQPILQSIAFNLRKGTDIIKPKKSFLEQLIKV